MRNSPAETGVARTTSNTTVVVVVDRARRTMMFELAMVDNCQHRESLLIRSDTGRVLAGYGILPVK